MFVSIHHELAIASSVLYSAALIYVSGHNISRLIQI